MPCVSGSSLSVFVGRALFLCVLLGLVVMSMTWKMRGEVEA